MSARAGSAKNGWKSVSVVLIEVNTPMCKSSIDINKREATPSGVVAFLAAPAIATNGSRDHSAHTPPATMKPMMKIGRLIAE